MDLVASGFILIEGILVELDYGPIDGKAVGRGQGDADGVDMQVVVDVSLAGRVQELCDVGVEAVQPLYDVPRSLAA